MKISYYKLLSEKNIRILVDKLYEKIYELEIENEKLKKDNKNKTFKKREEIRCQN